jgi:competence protein ComEC
MAESRLPPVPLGEETGDAALQHPPWRKPFDLSSAVDAAEDFLARAGFDRGPWLAIAFGGGIATWFALGQAWQWVAALAAGLLLATGAVALWKERPERTHLQRAALAVGLLFSAGVSVIWARSELAGAEPIARPAFVELDARVLERIEQPAEDRVRLVLAARDPENGAPVKVRVNLPLERDRTEFSEGARVQLKARLMPPAPPMLPGSYDFARAAWFEGLAATGAVLGDVELVEPPPGRLGLREVQRRLSAHVRAQLGGSPGEIAAALASGDRGAIDPADEEAMRDAGLTHLLSISGLHVSAVIAAAYFLAIKLLAAWPWLALRVRLPLFAAAVAAGTGVAYTLLTGAEVPTVRSCVGALLVLGALALGREPLSMRMVAVAAIAVLLLWPESLVGPSFQMSFAAVVAIVALHGCAPVQAFLAPREEGWLAWLARRVVMLLATGLLIEAALMPIALFHFHRAGLYGAFANVVAIPLTTFASMPLIALALLLDLVGLGAPVWWLAGKSLELLLWLAHVTASQPGAVKLMPQMTGWTFALFILGGLWLALWRGRARLWAFVPIAAASALLLMTPVPDLLVSGDGKHVGIAGEGAKGTERLLVLRDTKSEFTRENLTELAGVEGEPLPLTEWPGAQCNDDACALTLHRGGRDWHLLMTRSRDYLEIGALNAACAASDIVVSNRRLPRTCLPRWLKADRGMLRETGGLSIVLEDRAVTTVAESQGDHGWWRGGVPRTQ